MLRTGGDIITEVIARGNISTTSSYTTDAILKSSVNRAYRWASAYRKWVYTEGRSSTTFASLSTNQTDDLETTYPEGWKADSIRLLTIGGKRVQKLTYEDFRIFREERPEDEEKVFTDLGRLVMVNPNIGDTGTVISYGQFTPVEMDLSDLTSATDTTVFSDHEEDGNDAIVEKTIAYLKAKQKRPPQEIQYHNDLATQMLDKIWERHLNEQYAYQTKDRGLFKRVDILTGFESDDLNQRDQFIF